MLELQWQIVLIQSAAFVILVLVLKKFAFGPIGQVLDARRDEVRDTLDRIAEDRRAMEETRAEYEARLANIEAEARERITLAVGQAQDEAAEILSKARADASAARERAIADIEQERHIALAEIRNEAADLIVSATARVLRETVDESVQRRLISQFIQEVDAESPGAGHA